MDVIKLVHGSAKNTNCSIHKFGATITSWEVEGVENIFVSSKAILDGSKAIRGGIPVCFPSFGPWEFGAQHGFARSSKDWQVVQGPDVDCKSGDASVTLALEDTEETRKIWNFKFRFLFKIALRPRALELNIDIENLGSEGSLDFTMALHTYFKVPDVTQCTISSLKGLTFTDKVKGGELAVEERDLVKVNEFTDRVYQAAPDLVELTGLEGGRKLQLAKTNFRDFVVWNPWAENAAKLSDFGDDEYKNMICVEAVQTSNKISLAASEHFKASHVLSVKD